MNLGVRRLAQGDNLENGQTGASFELDFEYGDYVDKDLRKPFEAFRLNVQLNGNDKKALGWINLDGNLWQTDVKDTPKTRHRFMVELNYTYVDNNAYQFGRNSVGIGFRSRWHLSPNWRLRGRLGTDAIILGAVNSEFVGVENREYDFGPGIGLVLGLSVERKGFEVAELFYEGLLLHTVSGSDGDHVIQMTGLRAAWPVYRRLGIGAGYFVFLRDSYFRRFPDVSQRNPQLRIFATWHPS